MRHQQSLNTDVLSAARQRICNVFANGLPVYLDFSGGKDSLTLAHLTWQLIEEGAIDKSLLRLEFVDEEAIFPCVEKITLDWRERFASIGVPFLWYCIEVKHYSCFNMLENDESFICWDRTKSNTWVRQPPPFAIRSHPKLLPREMWHTRVNGKTYQEFLGRLQDGLHMTGVRVAESVQRRQTIGNLGKNGVSYVQSTVAPIYDWLDADVWLYLKNNDIEIPDAYLFMYQIGVPRRNMRISQFFSIDTAQSLVRMSEFYPGLMERILIREPSAYLAALYWDSEMFRRRSSARRAIENDEPENARSQLLHLIAHPPETLTRSHGTRMIYDKYRQIMLKFGSMMTEKHCRAAYDALISGDPKGRVARALITQIISDAGKDARKKAEISNTSSSDSGHGGHAGASGAGHARSVGAEGSAHPE